MKGPQKRGDNVFITSKKVITIKTVIKCSN